MLQDDDDADTDYEVPADPAEMDWPITLPLDVAMGDNPLMEIFAAHGLGEDDYIRLKNNPQFVMEVRKYKEELAKDGASFRIRAKMQAEFMLKKSFQMVYDPAVPAPVKADLIKSTVRWAGYEPKKETDAGAGGPNFQVNIILKDD